MEQWFVAIYRVKTQTDVTLDVIIFTKTPPPPPKENIPYENNIFFKKETGKGNSNFAKKCSSSSTVLNTVSSESFHLHRITNKSFLKHI
jgi:hypothetical protein